MQRPVKGQKSGSENRTSFLESKLHCPPGKSAKMSILAVTLKNEDPLNISQDISPFKVPAGRGGASDTVHGLL